MKNLTDQTNVTNGVAFPNSGFIDCSGPGNKDGSAITAAVMNEFAGFAQASLIAAGKVPNGSTESASLSQILDSLAALFSSVGEVVAWQGAVDAPTLAGKRLLQLAGQRIAIADYPLLASAVYCGDARNATAKTYCRVTAATGGSRSTTGGYLVLPDFRGCYLAATGMVGDNGILTKNTSGSAAYPGEHVSQRHFAHGHMVQMTRTFTEPFSSIDSTNPQYSVWNSNGFPEEDDHTAQYYEGSGTKGFSHARHATVDGYFNQIALRAVGYMNPANQAYWLTSTHNLAFGVKDDNQSAPFSAASHFCIRY